MNEWEKDNEAFLVKTGQAIKTETPKPLTKKEEE